MSEQPRQEQLNLAEDGNAGTGERSVTAAAAPVQPGLFPDDSVPDELVGYRGPSACQIAGITYRQLDYWARTSLVVPSIRSAAGSGSQRLYSFKDILVLKIVKRLLDTGISLHNIRVAVDHLRQRGVEDLANITLFSDGTTVYECTSAEEVVDLLQGGQGVFGIAVSGAMRELTGVIADFPGERADGGESIAEPEDELASRRKHRDLTIGFFLHIPFPPVELFMQLPWRTEIVKGLLGADLVGFHLTGGAQNFLFLSRRLIGANTSRGAVGVRSRYGEVELESRVVRVGAFPISIDSTALDQTARHRDIRRRAREIRAELGNPRKVLLGVDRLDYTKGIDVRLKAFSELLAEGRAKRDDTVLVQLATPSRERVDSYQQLRNDIERQVGHINGEYGEVGHPVVHYLHRPVPRNELIAFFVAADVMLVTPLRDGMNLVAKEYVACRSDLGGALVLSEFTGAAAELRQAYLVNPHDLEGVKDTVEAALNQSVEEGRRRMRSLRRQVLAHDVDRWARSFLDALAESGPRDG